MPFKNLKDIEEKVIYPGYKAKFIHSENITLAHWTIEEGSSFPEHFHENEQILSVLEGKLELRIGDKTKILKQGEAAIIPPYIAHSGKAIKKTNAIDVFYPLRRDYF
ncbi:MAG: Cupin domain protein [Candidatus Methanofastidiosum methylothiophilum]|uniref:Cupin domain protein n=1 Tax=Candidatus Methanofastidiosum methylothiophilum TaxID=1705564 RepID=A0A150J5A8_9EURY|nr:MAG: Cupin domain protein [Candidatus Methanofastidiosum methylthiophilus]